MRNRGAGWVVAQSILLVVVSVLAAVGGPHARPVTGIALMIGGALVAGSAALTLGRSLTPFPRPKRSGRLVTGGPFRLVRHPIYAGLLLVVVGVSLAHNLWALVPAAALLVLWTLKARVEERHLVRAFPEYGDYAKRVRARFVPFVF